MGTFLYPLDSLISPVLSLNKLLLSRILAVGYNGYCLFPCFFLFFFNQLITSDSTLLIPMTLSAAADLLEKEQAGTVSAHLKEEVRVEPNSSFTTLPHCCLQVPVPNAHPHIHQFKTSFNYLKGFLTFYKFLECIPSSLCNRFLTFIFLVKVFLGDNC